MSHSAEPHSDSAGAGAGAGDGAGTDADVVVVGCGPVGLVLSLLLAHRGRRVVVLEQYPDQYPFPRVVAFDGETARNFASAGIGESLNELGEALGEYAFQNAAGQKLLSFEAPYRPDRDGWPKATVMHQPTFESALRAHAETLDNVRLLTGHRAEHLADHGDHVEVLAPGPELGDRPLTARWAVGCDGANSFVREHMGAKVTDLGFTHDWLLCDVVFHEPREFTPNDVQICDPARPTTIVASGRGHRRWEFMRLPGETNEELSTVERMWELLEPHGVTPDNATLTRNIVYTFQASTTDKWRAGRMLLAGDSAHQMPPFAGQGMCSGIRDAANLAWKLDLVLGGVAGERLLDTYQAERGKQVRHTIDMSVEVGRIVSELDQEAAERRDAYLLAMKEDAPERDVAPSFFPLEDGVLRRDARAADGGPTGGLVPQGRVARGEERGLFDDVAGRGFVLLSTLDPYEVLEGKNLAFLERLDAHLVRVLPVGTPPKQVKPHEVVDLENVYLPFLDGAGSVAVLVRPDFHVFGTARDRSDLPRLVGDLRRQLTATAALSRAPLAAR
ncbi:bifunctional 3-(3-hydroxy-phenyl)propionate/3-hydroxycinnamic acid hydroxylase [Streptomyces sp. HNM0575]|nr:bifunctional 3-(3-hydroxy-phenyl)propionate/3-hydroxycinnamic acid hydroxylase [Streptomyces sp. HNM0575]